MIDIPTTTLLMSMTPMWLYPRFQFDSAIKQLEELTGKKFDEKKFEQACQCQPHRPGLAAGVRLPAQYKPSPYSGFDLFNHMADVV